MKFNHSTERNSAKRKIKPSLNGATFSIALTYLLSGINLIAAGIIEFFNAGGSPAVWLFMVGLVMLLMVPISIVDPRKEMHGTLNVFSGIIMLVAFCGVFAFVFSLWWIVILCVELIIYFLILRVVNKKRKHK